MRRGKKIARELARRIAAWEATTQNKASDIARKHPNGFKKPGSGK